ncbi:branched-chain amino acid ABC transporter permease [Variovorax sp. V213]|uniref:branched-chain amino acid ABC transporter permease n=1 Tax=Variovorax sp. V213 TaxID=3065955 RepID=UPI0034E8B266
MTEATTSMRTTSLRLGAFAVPVACAIAIGVFGPLMGNYVSDFVVKVMILSIFALSLELLVGMTGLVSLGHAAFYGIGAYVTVLASGSEGGNLALLLPAAMGVAALYALFVGALSLRTRGVYFIMVTLAFAQMAFFVFHDTKVGGGSDGIYMYVRPAIGKLDMENRMVLFYVVLASLVFTYGLLALVRRSRFGAALAGIRVNEQRMRAAGFPVYGYKLAAFVLAGALAGLAGFLLASRDGVVNPELMAWHNSGEVLLMVILGGLGHLRGAVIGAVAFTLLKEIFSTHAVMGPLADHWQLTLGIAIIVFVALLPKGLIGLVKRLSPKEAA